MSFSDGLKKVGTKEPVKKTEEPVPTSTQVKMGFVAGLKKLAGKKTDPKKES